MDCKLHWFPRLKNIYISEDKLSPPPPPPLLLLLPPPDWRWDVRKHSESVEQLFMTNDKNRVVDIKKLSLVLFLFTLHNVFVFLLDHRDNLSCFYLPAWRHGSFKIKQFYETINIRIPSKNHSYHLYWTVPASSYTTPYPPTHACHPIVLCESTTVVFKKIMLTQKISIQVKCKEVDLYAFFPSYKKHKI